MSPGSYYDATVNEAIDRAVAGGTTIPLDELIACTDAEERRGLIRSFFFSSLSRGLGWLADHCQRLGHKIESVPYQDVGDICEAIVHFGDCPDLAKAIIARGASVDWRGVFNYTPLMYAIERNCIGVAKVLLECGADPNARTVIDDDLTAIEIAAQLGRQEFVDLLAAHGASPSRYNFARPRR